MQSYALSKLAYLWRESIHLLFFPTLMWSDADRRHHIETTQSVNTQVGTREGGLVIERNRLVGQLRIHCGCLPFKTLGSRPCNITLRRSRFLKALISLASVVKRVTCCSVVVYSSYYHPAKVSHRQRHRIILSRENLGLESSPARRLSA